MNDFWISIVKRYRMSRLSKEQIEWIIRAKVNGKLTNKQIADVQGISVSRVQQLYREYKRTEIIHEQRKAGRHKQPVPEEIKNKIIELYSKYRINASYIGRILREEGLHIDNNRINEVLKEAGFAMSEPRKWHRKKWIRYEREHSNSLWHVDWHMIKDPRWKGLWLIVYEDDSSRFITGYGIYPNPTSKYSVEILKKAIEKYGKPEQILSDHGTTFYGVEADEREKGLTEFEEFLIKEKITFIVGRVDHPQTNGKVEKFFDIFEKKVKFFNTVDEFMNWYNFIRPHGAFDIERLETPAMIFYKRLPKKEIIDKSFFDRLERGV